MAETIIKTKFEFDVQDAITAVDRYKASIKDAGTTTTTSMAGASNALKDAKSATTELDNAEKSHHNSMKNESGLIDVLNQKRREDVREKRALKFVLNETAEAAAIVSIALSQMGAVTGDSGKQIQKLTSAAQEGLGAFSGLSFALSAMPGGQIIAVLAGIALAISKIAEETGMTKEQIESFKNSFRGATTQQLEDNKKELQDFKKNSEIKAETWKKENQFERIVRDETTNAITKTYEWKSKTAEAFYSTLVKDAKNAGERVEQLDKDIDSKKLTSFEVQQIRNKALINAIGDRYKREEQDARAEAILQKQNVENSKALENEKKDTITAINSELNAKINDINKRKQKEIDDHNKEIVSKENQLSTKIEQIHRDRDIAFIMSLKNGVLATASSVKDKLQIEHDFAVALLEIEKVKEVNTEKNEDAKKAILEKYKNKKLQLDSEYNLKYKDESEKTHKEAIDAISKYELSVEDDKNKKLRKDADVAIKAIEKDELMNEQQKADAKLRINQNVQKQIEKNSLDGFKKTYADISKLAKQSASTISDIVTSGARYAREKIENEKQDVLDRYDVEIEAAGNNEAKKKELLAQRKKAEDEYNLKVKQAKTEEWIAERDSKIVMSIIDTASAVVEALPNIPLSIAAGVMGAVQTGIIASQPIPKFHTGGQMFFNAPPSQEMPILIRGQETVRVTTPEQERNNSRAINVTVIVNNNCPTPKIEWIKEGVEEGLKKSGLTVDKYFINNNTGINFA